jgi:hypothetical protein
MLPVKIVLKLSISPDTKYYLGGNPMPSSRPAFAESNRSRGSTGAKKGENLPGETMSAPMNYRDRLRDRECIRIHAQIKHEELKAEAIDILIGELHRQMRSGATVSFDHNLARKIQKLIIGDRPRAKIIALVRTGVCAAPKGTL